jgi:hypothetical protein
LISDIGEVQIAFIDRLFLVNCHIMIRMINRFSIFCLLLVLPFSLLAQNAKEKTNVTFEELYDEPYSINKLFIGFQPLYGELFATNVNAGFGAEAHYYHDDKIDFKASYRKTYSSQFFDFNRQAALDNNEGNSYMVDRPQVFSYLEVGGTYHVKDFDESGKTTMVLYKKSFKGNRWAATVPLRAEIPCKVRKIYGVRLGGIYWNSSIDLNRVLKAQGLTNTDLVRADGTGLPLLDPSGKELAVFGNLHATTIYVGGSMSWIRNVAVSFDKYEEGLDDGMLTLYFDVMFAPGLSMDPIRYRDDPANSTVFNSYSTDAVQLSSFGLRAGIDGRFNRTLGWSYGGELGLRPTISGQGFFVMFKISFPVFGTNLDYKVESFGK